MRAKNQRSTATAASGIALLTAMACGAASAQDNPPSQTADASPALEEVLVTSQKREERLQDVPAAISAVSGVDVQRDRLNDVYALAASVPSFNMTQDSAVSQQLNIRGVVSVKLNDASAEPSVGMFVDEVYVPRMGSAFTDFYDLERIEVIRGPQGVLLGKNVIGGALSVITAKPAFERDARVTASFGNYASKMVEGFVNGPLGDSVAARVAFKYGDRDGYNENILLNRELDDLTSYQARAQFLYRNDAADLRMLFALDYGKDDSNGTIRAAIDDFAVAGIGPIQAWRTARGIGPRQDFSTQPEYVRRKSVGASLRIDWGAFDGATLTSITAYRDSTAEWGYNQIGSGGSPAFPSIVDTFVFQTEEPTSVSQELRLASDASDSPLEWLVGAYYQHDSVKRPYQHLAKDSPLPTFTGHSFYDASAKIDTTAAFGQVGYSFGGGFKFTAGVRYLRDDKTGRKNVTCLEDFGDGRCVTPLAGPKGTRWSVDYGKVWTATTPQGTLEWRPNEAFMVYASAARGFKGGGWDFIPPTPLAATISFEPEEVVNYELGIKTDLLERRLRVNAAVFQMDYTDLQAQRTDLVCLCLITSNAGKARIEGAEIELTAAVTNTLTLRAAGSFLDPKYIDYDDRRGNVYNGKVMQRTPKTKYNLGLDYAMGTGEWSEGITLRVNYSHQSKIFWAPDNISYEPAYGLLDASVRIQKPGSNWMLTLWGKNLDDQLYSQLGLPFLGDLVEVWGPPRTYGVDFTYSF